MHPPKTSYIFTLFVTTFVLALCLSTIHQIAAQDEGSKGLLPDEAGVKTNPKRKKRPRPITLQTQNRFTRRPAPAGTEYGQVGITFWRVDYGSSKGIEEVGKEQTQDRLDINATYTNGDTFRINVVSPTGGYLYIVDQEQYSDGSIGPAVLAFPTLGIRKGNNLIQAWESVQIPAYPKVWRFKSRTLVEGEVRKVQTAELLTIIISPKPLIDHSLITDKQLAFTKGEFESWKTKWKTTTTVQQFDMENSTGKVVDARSKGVEEVGTEAATNDEELDAQTTYQLAIKPGTPIMVTVPLRFASAAEKKKP